VQIKFGYRIQDEGNWLDALVLGVIDMAEFG
jgi:hypothetical protein